MDWIYERGLSCGDVTGLINSWIFSERDRSILYRRYIDGITIENLSLEFDISVSQIKRIVRKGTEAILSHCW